MTRDDRQKRPAGEPAVRTLAMPRDTNGLGDIFGGWLMSHADIAGSIRAYRRAGGKVVTVAVDTFSFLQPVYVGDVVSFFSRVDSVGRTSLKVSVDVYAERPGPEPTREIKVAEAGITYVHIGDDRRPRVVPDQDSFES
ncbi:acyl-CoA thioesterase [soil metagenome]